MTGTASPSPTSHLLNLLEPVNGLSAGATISEFMLCSIAISMKRIADALSTTNDYGEMGGQAIAGSIARGMREGRT